MSVCIRVRVCVRVCVSSGSRCGSFLSSRTRLELCDGVHRCDSWSHRLTNRMESMMTVVLLISFPHSQHYNLFIFILICCSCTGCTAFSYRVFVHRRFSSVFPYKKIYRVVATGYINGIDIDVSAVVDVVLLVLLVFLRFLMFWVFYWCVAVWSFRTFTLIWILTTIVLFDIGVVRFDIGVVRFDIGVVRFDIGVVRGLVCLVFYIDGSVDHLVTYHRGNCRFRKKRRH